MPFNIDSYTTTVGSSLNAQRITTAVSKAIILDELDKKPESTLGIEPFGDFHPLFITGTYPSEGDIPSFAHPISILSIKNKNFICSDLRQMLKKDNGLGISRRISNQIDFEYAISRNVLNLYWASGRSSEFTSGFGFSAKVFADWVSQVLRNSLGIEPGEQLDVQIQALAYYYSLCNGPEVKISTHRQDITDWIVNLTGFSGRIVQEKLQDVKDCRKFADLIHNIQVVVDNVRIRKFDEGGFLSAIRSNWYGIDADKVLGVCIEHPPTWTAIVHHTLNSKGYQRCLIGQVALKSGQHGRADAFMRHYYTIFGNGIRMENYRVPSSTSYDPRDFGYNGLEMSMEAEKQLPKL